MRSPTGLCSHGASRWRAGVRFGLCSDRVDGGGNSCPRWDTRDGTGTGSRGQISASYALPAPWGRLRSRGPAEDRRRRWQPRCWYAEPAAIVLSSRRPHYDGQQRPRWEEGQGSCVRGGGRAAKWSARIARGALPRAARYLGGARTEQHVVYTVLIVVTPTERGPGGRTHGGGLAVPPRPISARTATRGPPCLLQYRGRGPVGRTAAVQRSRTTGCLHNKIANPAYARRGPPRCTNRGAFNMRTGRKHAHAEPAERKHLLPRRHEAGAHARTTGQQGVAAARRRSAPSSEGAR